jgi:PLP dependent protein
MSSVAANIKKLKGSLPDHVKVVAVSKTKPPALIMDAWNEGIRHFGENRVQELLTKRVGLPDDIKWHLIGHLQTNKVKNVVPFISMIESVDSFKLLKVIDREAKAAGKSVDCLLQIHIASEESKYGFSLPEIEEMITSEEFSMLRNVSIRGVMGMATFTDDLSLIRQEFRQLRSYFETLKDKHFALNSGFSEISMGMSGDYMIAVEEGSTIIRVGSLIFGER